MNGGTIDNSLTGVFPTGKYRLMSFHAKQLIWAIWLLPLLGMAELIGNDQVAYAAQTGFAQNAANTSPEFSDLRLCDGTRFAEIAAGPSQGWAPFLGTWATERPTNHPRYPGLSERIALTLEPAPNVNGAAKPYVRRVVKRRVGLDASKFANYLPVSALVGTAVVEGVPPTVAVYWREGETLRYVGNSPNPGCVKMTFERQP